MNAVELRNWEKQNIQRWLSCFDVDVPPMVGFGPSGETLWVKNFMLPDWCVPDKLDIVLVMKNYPVEPPKGIYLLSKATNRNLITSLQSRFNVFQNTAFHGAPTGIQGYEWICFGYLNGWRFNNREPHKGDNICKMLRNFWRTLEE